MLVGYIACDLIPSQAGAGSHPGTTLYPAGAMLTAFLALPQTYNEYLGSLYLLECIHMCMNVSLHFFVWVSLHLHVCVCVCAHVYMYVCVSLYVCISMCVCVYFENNSMVNFLEPNARRRVCFHPKSTELFL